MHRRDPVRAWGLCHVGAGIGLAIAGNRPALAPAAGPQRLSGTGRCRQDPVVLFVGWGTCVEAERTPAFWPWSSALRGVLGTLSAAGTAELTPRVTERLAEVDTPAAADRLAAELADHAAR